MYTDISTIVIKNSNNCNLNCTYCFEREKFKNVRFADYEALLNFLKNINIGPDHLYIKFTGGEPLLFEKDIREAYKILKKIERFNDITTHFSLTTNGTKMNELLGLFDDGILDPELCKVSWDGIKSCNIRKTVAYNDTDMKNNIKLLGESGYGAKTTIRMALTEESITDLYFSFLYALQNKCRVLEYYYLVDYAAYNSKEFINKANIVFRELARLTTLFNFTYINWEPLYRAKHYPDNAFKSICNHLGKMLYIDGKGNVYPCSFFSKDSIYENVEFQLGTIYDGLDSNRISQFIARYRNMLFCDNSTCKNNQCFECPAANMYKQKSRLKQTCALRMLEKSIFDEYYKENIDA